MKKFIHDHLNEEDIPGYQRDINQLKKEKEERKFKREMKLKNQLAHEEGLSYFGWEIQEELINLSSDDDEDEEGNNNNNYKVFQDVQQRRINTPSNSLEVLPKLLDSFVDRISQCLMSNDVSPIQVQREE